MSLNKKKIRKNGDGKKGTLRHRKKEKEKHGDGEMKKE